MNLAKLHTVYSLLLAHCFTLRPEHQRALKKHWGYDEEQIYSNETIEWLIQPPPGRWCNLHVRAHRELIHGEHWTAAHYPPRAICKCDEPIPPARVKICSMPSPILQVISANMLACDFDLQGVPGFFREDTPPWPPPPPDSIAEVHGWIFERLGPWRMNLKYRDGLLVPYKARGYIVGIRIYRSVRDRTSFLLTSRGLPGGARAIACQDVAA